MPILKKAPPQPLNTSISVRMTWTERRRIQDYALAHQTTLSDAARRLLNKALSQSL